MNNRINLSFILVASCLATLLCGCVGNSALNGQSQPKIALIAEGCTTNGLVLTRRTVTDAISAAGYMPLILPDITATNRVDAILDRADALVIFGAIKGSGAVRNEFESRLVRRAAERRIPVVGFCHGHQLINMALGGTIARNPTNVAVKVVHHGKASPYVKDCFHEAEMKPGSLVARVLGEGRQRINTSHNFCINKLADGLVVTATADDGVIEAFEHRELPIFGFQFHPERIAKYDPRFVELIRQALQGGVTHEP